MELTLNKLKKSNRYEEPIGITLLEMGGDLGS